MLQKITHRAADLIELLGVEGKILLAGATRSASLVGVALIACVVACLALLGLAAAAVVALVPAMGTAGALALVAGILLVGAALAGVAIWSLLLANQRGRRLSEAEQMLKSQREHLMAELRTPEPPPPAPANPFPSLPSVNLGAIDPVLLLASIGAVTAVVGPKRMFKAVGSLAGNMAVINSVIAAGKAAMAGATGSEHASSNGVHRG
ncbi:MAG: hypothetical protein QM783_14315 [Phycisphaerales bacterium]